MVHLINQIKMPVLRTVDTLVKDGFMRHWVVTKLMKAMIRNMQR